MFIHRSTLRNPIALLALAAAASALFGTHAAHAQTPSAQVVAEGQGYKKLVIDDPSYRQMFARSKTARATAAPMTAAQKTSAPASGSVLQLTSLRGVRDAGLPSWLEQELLEEAGYGAWTEVPAARLDARIDTVVVDLDAMNDLTSGMSAPPPVQKPRVSPSGFFDDVIGAIQDCTHKQVEQETRSFTREFSASKKSTSRSTDPNLRIDVTGELGAKGTLSAVVHYGIKKRCGIPYGATLDYADLSVDAALDGTLGVAGSVSARYDGALIQTQHLELWRYYQSWWVYAFEIGAELTLALDYGAKLSASASAAVALDYDTSGSLGLTWRCTSSDCSKTRSETDLKFVLDDPSRQAQVNVQVTPWVDTNVSATVGLYASILELAKAKVGLVAALPVRYFGYTGNQCSDADGDGTPESVRASLFSTDAELYGYLSLEVGGKKTLRWLDLDLLGFDDPIEAPLHHLDGVSGKLYRRNLYYRDFVAGGSTVVQPVLKLTSTSGLDSSLSLSRRSCYPFADAPEYEVDWGDGSPLERVESSTLQHRWRAPGTYTIAARLPSDGAGRDLAGPPLRLSASVASGTTPVQAPSSPSAGLVANGLTPLPCSQEATLRSLSGTVPLSFQLKNDTSAAVQLFWLDYSGKRVSYSTLQRGQQLSQSSYLTHPWVATDSAGKCLALYTPSALR